MQPVRYKTFLSKIQKSIFENKGMDSDYLERAHSFLMTVKPNESVKFKLAFSSA